MKKKRTIFIVIGVILIGVLAYCYPKPFGNMIQSGNNVFITNIESSVNNGMPSIESMEYTVLSGTKELDELMGIMEKYNYHRSWNTLFSKDGMSEIGTRQFNIYVAGENEFVNRIILSDDGEAWINEHLYRVGKSSEMVNEIVQFLEENPNLMTE